MPKVNIIGGDMSRYKLEKEINEFIKNKNVINISYAVHMCGYSTYREACILYEDTPCYPIVSGKIADEIREKLKIEPTDEMLEGIKILKEMFERREQNG